VFRRDVNNLIVIVCSALTRCWNVLSQESIDRASILKVTEARGDIEHYVENG
jgi:hypothetical protein